VPSSPLIVTISPGRSEPASCAPTASVSSGDEESYSTGIVWRLVRSRWDIDERGRGVADATRLIPDAETLVGFMAEEDWVTEEPDAHLLPHVRRVAARFPLEETRAEIDGEGVLAISPRRPRRSPCSGRSPRR
jgi:hypothetical protein